MQSSPVIMLVNGRVAATANGTTTVPVTDAKAADYAGLQNYDSFIVLINITSGGAVTGTLQIFIEDSWNEGVTWDDVISSNTFAFGAAVTTQRFVVQGRIATTITQGSPAAAETLAAGTVRTGPFGDRIRVREVVSAIGGTPTGPTYSISVIPCRSENN